MSIYSQGSHGELSSILSRMPDFKSQKDRYTKAVRRGRHPISFKRSGELWYFAEETKKRLNRVASGQRLLDVIDDIEAKDGIRFDLDDWSVGGGSVGSQESLGNTSLMKPGSPVGERVNTRESTRSTGNPITDVLSGVNLLAPKRAKLAPLQQDVKKEKDSSKEDDLINFQMNGVHIDVRRHTQLNYGNFVVLLNEHNECLCVDKDSRVRIKTKDQLLEEDRMCFKLVDLNDYHNPGEVVYGGDLWLQLIDTPTPGAKIYNDFFSALVVGAKIFSLETVGTQYLDNNWAKNEKRTEMMKQYDDIDSDEEYENRMAEIERKKKEAEGAKKAEEMQAQMKKKGKLSKWGMIKDKKVGLKALVASKEMLQEAKAKTKAGEAKDGSGSHQNKGGEEEEEEAVIGDVCGSAITVHLALSHNGNNEMNEIVSKEAYNLGAFVPNCAENFRIAQNVDQSDKKGKSTDDKSAKADLGQNHDDEEEEQQETLPEPGDILESNRPIYLSQDMYCLSNPSGSGYQPWPLRSDDFSEENKQLKAAKLKLLQESSSMLGMPGFGETAKSRGQSRAKSSKSNSGKNTASAKRSAKNSRRARNLNTSIALKSSLESEYGVMRKVVKTGKDRRLALDSKCTWRFCLIDSLAESGEMTKAELHAAQMITHAKDKLRESEMMRRGHHRYEGSTVPVVMEGTEPPTTNTGTGTNTHSGNSIGSINDMSSVGQGGVDARDHVALHKESIPGGERFSLHLRKNVSNHLLHRESEILASRREKESVLKQYFASNITDWDVQEGKLPDDVQSYVSGFNFEQFDPTKLSPAVLAMNEKLGIYQDPYAHNGSNALPITTEGDSQAGESTGSDTGSVILPANHRQQYVRQQRSTLKQKTLTLRKEHYLNYPHFQKKINTLVPDPDTKEMRPLLPYEETEELFGLHFAFNDHKLSDGEKVLSLRQAFEGIKHKEHNVKSANLGRDDSTVNPRFSMRLVTPSTPSGHTGPFRDANAIEEEKLRAEMEAAALRAKEERELAERIQNKLNVLQREDGMLKQGLLHKEKKALDEKLKNMKTTVVDIDEIGQIV